MDPEPEDLIKQRMDGVPIGPIAQSAFGGDYVAAADATTKALDTFPAPFETVGNFRTITMWRYEWQIKELQDRIKEGDHNPQHYARLQTALDAQAKLMGAYAVTTVTGETLRMEFPGVDMEKLAGSE